MMESSWKGSRASSSGVQAVGHPDVNSVVKRASDRIMHLKVDIKSVMLSKCLPHSSEVS